MNPDELIPGKEYLIEGREQYHPVGFGTDRRYRNYINKGKFLGEYVVGEDKTVLVFDGGNGNSFQIQVKHSNPKEPRVLGMKLNRNITIDKIVEADKTT